MSAYARDCVETQCSAMDRKASQSARETSRIFDGAGLNAPTRPPYWAPRGAF